MIESDDSEEDQDAHSDAPATENGTKKVCIDASMSSGSVSGETPLRHEETQSRGETPSRHVVSGETPLRREETQAQGETPSGRGGSGTSTSSLTPLRKKSIQAGKEGGYVHEQLKWLQEDHLK